ncbi:MAG TPA: zinc-dependent alcohol dehydrogenase family protein [Acidimicrobiales bacterium]|nr:zinc-dependent alcohol dehydrogenase family protein [Acidimicrobiales bacterium]
MRAWVVRSPRPIDDMPLAFVDRPAPRAGPGEVRVRVSMCGVCRTDLHLAEGDLAPRRPDVVPGHQAVGVVDQLGPGASRLGVGERVGIAWLHRSCGSCRFCRRGDENLCLQPLFTGWDTDGGYAEHAVVPEDFAYRLPDEFSDEQVAPLLCAGIIGFRALRRAEVPTGGRLGIYGFGASAHLAAQVALADGATVHVMTRSEKARRLALELGCASAGDTYDRPPEPLDAAIIFAPAGEIVPAALEVLDRGGTLAIAGIHLTDIPSLRYADHLFQERQLRSVTANTRRDGEEFLARAATIPVRVQTVLYPLERAADALADLAHDRVTGAAVLHIGPTQP